MNTTMCTSLCRLAIVLLTVLLATISMVTVQITVLHLPAITILANNISNVTIMFWSCFMVALFVLVIAYVVLLSALIVLQFLFVLCMFASLISRHVLQRDTLPVTVASFFILLNITSQAQTKILLRDIERIMEVAWLFVASIRKVPSKISGVMMKVLFGKAGMEHQTEKEVEEGDLYFDAQQQFEEDESVVTMESLVDEVFSQDEDGDTVDTAQIVIDGFHDMVDNTELDAFGSFARSGVDATLEATRSNQVSSSNPDSQLLRVSHTMNSIEKTTNRGNRCSKPHDSPPVPTNNSILEEIDKLEAVVDQISKSNIEVWKTGLLSLGNLRHYQSSQQEMIAQFAAERGRSNAERDSLRHSLDMEKERRHTDLNRLSRELTSTIINLQEIQGDKNELIKINEEARATRSELEQKVINLEAERDLLQHSLEKEKERRHTDLNRLSRELVSSLINLQEVQGDKNDLIKINEEAIATQSELEQKVINVEAERDLLQHRLEKEKERCRELASSLIDLEKIQGEEAIATQSEWEQKVITLEAERDLLQHTLEKEKERCRDLASSVIDLEKIQGDKNELVKITEEATATQSELQQKVVTLEQELAFLRTFSVSIDVFDQVSEDSFITPAADATLDATVEVVNDLPRSHNEDVVPQPIKTRYGRIIRKPSLYSDYYCSISQRKPSRRR